MNTTHRLLGAFAALLLLVPAASADWFDDFDSYPLGSGLHGQGGWEGWDGNPAADAYVTDAYSQSAPHSAEIIPTSDIVQMFTETSGQWIMTGWNYIPTGSTGQQYFIMLNTYAIGGPNAWSLQVLFDSDTGMMSIVEGSATAPIINDQWVEVRVEIDLDLDTQDIYYNGTLMESLNWSGTGVPEIAALDLFSNAGSTIYWDDLSLIAEPTAAGSTSWGQIKASFR